MPLKTAVKKDNAEGVLVVSTFPKTDIFSSVAKNLIMDKHLCACINVIKINSLYYWKGKLEVQEEYMAIFKSTRKRLLTLIHEIEKIHPYEVPEIVELKTGRFNKAYLSWLNNSTLDINSSVKSYRLKSKDMK
ncbi:MAG TPA: divalent cation tolerance protein CutA [Nitrososphaeraceae archaeon]|jgi:periplasmic divalent cation tolerance protein